MKKRLFITLLAGCILACSSALASGDVNVVVNGNTVDCNTILQDGTTYIPLRAVSEALGADVSWDGNSSTASVNTYLSEEQSVLNVVSENSSSVVAIVGNYKPEYISKQALLLREHHIQYLLIQ